MTTSENGEPSLVPRHQPARGAVTTAGVRGAFVASHRSAPDNSRHLLRTRVAPMVGVQ